MKNVYVVYTYERDVVVKPVTIQIKYKIEYEQIWSIRGDEHTHEHTNPLVNSSTESYHKRDVYHLVVCRLLRLPFFSSSIQRHDHRRRSYTLHLTSTIRLRDVARIPEGVICLSLQADRYSAVYSGYCV